MFTETTKKLGIFGNKNYRYIECHDSHVVFSYTQQGKAITIHVAADKTGLRYIKQSIDDFCNWLFYNYTSINMVLGVIDRRSVKKAAMKVNFKPIATDDKHTIYMRSL